MKKAIMLFCCILFGANLTAANAALQAEKQYKFIVFSDTHLGSKNKMDLAPSNHNKNNDLDKNTFKLLLSEAKKSIDREKLNPQSILLLGDLVDHTDGNLLLGSYNGRAKMLASNFSYFKQTFGSIPIFYAFGNNDSLSGDYQSFYTNRDIKYKSPWEVAYKQDWYLGFVSKKIAYCLKNDVAFPCVLRESINPENGFYSVRLAPKLKLITLNSVLFDRHIITYHGKNYNGELLWLKQQLKSANENSDSVIISMHVPLGTNLQTNKLFWQSEAQTKFLEIINSFDVNIIGILAGHTHMDELRVLLKKSDKVIPIIFTPGFSTSHGNSPSFKYFSLNYNDSLKQWKIADFKTYYFNKNNFLPLYSFQNYFCTNDKSNSVAACLMKYFMNSDYKNLLNRVVANVPAGNPNYKFNASDYKAENLFVFSDSDTMLNKKYFKQIGFRH